MLLIKIVAINYKKLYEIQCITKLYKIFKFKKKYLNFKKNI